MKIIEAKVTSDYITAKTLISAYKESLGVALHFQNYSDEIKRLAEYYGPPDGCLLIASEDDSAIGCIALRLLDKDTCEMKRLYVKPEWRGHGVGLKLSKGLILCARNRGYRKMVLDTLPSMTEAHALYRSLGFKRTENYYYNPLPDVIYLALDLMTNDNHAA